MSSDEVVTLFRTLEILARNAEPIARMPYNSVVHIRKLSRQLRMFIFKAPLIALRDSAFAVDPTLSEAGFQQIRAVLMSKFSSTAPAASRDMMGFLNLLQTLRIHI